MPQESLSERIERRLEDSGYAVVPWEDVSTLPNDPGLPGHTQRLAQYTGAVHDHQRLEDGVLDTVKLFAPAEAVSVSVTVVDGKDGPEVRFYLFYGPGGPDYTLKG